MIAMNREGARDRRRARPGARRGAPARPAARDSDRRQGQLRDRRPCRPRAGTLALTGFTTGRDAFQVKTLRDAGAIIIGKTNLHELASGITTISSLGGQTRNPYDAVAQPRRIERRHRRGGGRQLRRGRHGQRHLRLDPHSVGEQQPVRPARHDGPVEPRRHHPAVAHAGHRRPAGAHGHRPGDDARRHRRRRPGRRRHAGERRTHSGELSRSAEGRTRSRACASAW